MILFKTIKYKNILSVGNDFIEVRLDKSPTTLVSGVNGSGKSLLVESIFYSLYGRTYRNINKPQLINSTTRKGLLVEIEFSIGKKEYLVRRGMRPNVFEIFLDGSLINQSSDVREYQEILEKQILKMNHKSFSQIVVLGTANYIPFMQLSPGQRREVIEDLLDIEVFSVMNSLLRNRIVENRQAVGNAEYNIRLAEEKIDLIKKHIDEMKKNNDDIAESKRLKLSQYKTYIEQAQTSIVKLNDKVDIVRSLLDERRKLETRKTKIVDVENTLEQRRLKLKKDIGFFTDTDSCPTCKQDIDDVFKETTIDDRSKKLQSVIDSLQKTSDEISRIEKELDKYKDTVVRLNGLVDKISSINSKISSWNQTSIDLQDEIASLTKTTESYESVDELGNQKSILRDQRKHLTGLNKQKRTLEIVQSLLKDGGVKTKIIKQYIPTINKLIAKYLSSMEFFIQFELNEQFEEKILSRNLDEFTYTSFSEGERQRVNLALLFTWRAIARLRNSASTNLLILDEVFDSSVDQTGVDELIKILNGIEDSNIFVISHTAEGQLYDKFRSHIRFEKYRGFTRIV